MNPIFEELPKYLMQFLITASNNKYIFTFSRRLEVM